MKKRWMPILMLLLTVCWIAFIFVNSLEDGQSSGAKSDAVKEVVDQVASSLGDSDGVSAVAIRKSGHILEFLVLGILLCLDAFSLRLLSLPIAIPRLLITGGAVLAVGAAVAALDETVQRFSEGRVSSGWDVLIDLGGVAIGMLIFAAVYALVIRSRKKKQTAADPATEN